MAKYIPLHETTYKKLSKIRDKASKQRGYKVTWNEVTDQMIKVTNAKEVHNALIDR